MTTHRLAILTTLLSLSLFGLTPPASAAPETTERQLKRLYELAANPARSGNPDRVWIMDGFRDVDVDRFLSTEFSNIQNVMFTSVIVTDSQGKPVRDSQTGRLKLEDDGC